MKLTIPISAALFPKACLKATFLGSYLTATQSGGALHITVYANDPSLICPLLVFSKNRIAYTSTILAACPLSLS